MRMIAFNYIPVPAILGYKLIRVALGTRMLVSLHFRWSVAFHFFIRYVMEYFMECCLKNITRSRAVLNKMSAKEETIQATSFGVLEEAVDFMKKAHELMNQQALDLRQEKEAFESVSKKLDHVHFASTILHH